MRQIVLACLLLWPGWTEADDHPRLYGRSNLAAEQLRLLDLTDDDRRWLWSLRTLRLGVSQPDYPPFDLTGTGSDYEGISADYARLVAELLNLRVEVTRYGSRQQAVAALKAGELDLLGSANDRETAMQDLQLSAPYVEDRALLATRREPDGTLDVQAPRMKLAVLGDYLPEEDVIRLFPNAQVISFPSTLSALGAVSFGQADFFLGNALAAHYQLAKSQFGNVQLAEFSGVAPNHLGFALLPGSDRLLTLLNEALRAIPTAEHEAILRRWSVAGVNPAVGSPLVLSESEQRWLQLHPRLRVAIDPQFLPLSYRDSNGAFRGIAADILERIALRTGLSFDVVDAFSVQEMVSQVKSAEVDLLAALAPSPALDREVQFSRAFLTSSLVLVTRSSDDTVDDLATLSHRSVALEAGSYVQEMLNEQYPRMRVLIAKNSAEVLELVEAGRATAGVVTLIAARYMISQRHGDSLRISAVLPFEPANFALAVAHGAGPLQSILNKALLSIPLQEVNELTSRWHSEVIVADGYWQRYRALILQGFAAAALLWAVALGWISYLRRLIRRRVLAERALTDQLEFMRVMIDGTPHPIYVRDREGLLVTCNSSYLQALEVRREEVIGRQLSDIRAVDIPHAHAYEQEYQRVMALGQAIVEDRDVVLNNGVACTLHHWMLPYRGSDGRIVGLIAGWIDVTDRQQLCQAYQGARDEAEAANRAKTTFLASMSHEIRTPMNAVLGMLEMARKKASQGVLDQLALDVASDAAEGLLELIGDILDITRIESGHLDLTPQATALQPLFAALVRLFDGQARDKHLALRLEVNDEQALWAWVDPLRLKQVAGNLISNAIKFTAEGEVVVRLTITLHAGRVQLCLAVTDSGVGISEQDLPRVGRPFYQASNNKQSTRAGSGLGLSICRGLCEKMGGELTLRSELGLGTCATVRLSLAPAEPCGPRTALSPVTISATPRRLQVLVVDDYPANRLLLDHQLTWLGHRAVLAPDGQEGLKYWLRGGFDVVISDCQMPGLDGRQLAKAIRQHEQRQGLQPCLLLGCTANAQAEERARCLAAGMDDCLFKPLSLASLATHLTAHLADGGSRTAVKVARNPAIALEVLDLNALSELTGADPQAIRTLLDDLQEANRGDLSELNGLRHGGDPQALVSLVHRIKGAARIVQARQLLEAIAEIEQAVDAGMALHGPVERMCEAMAVLDEHLSDVCG